MTATPWGFRDILPEEAQAREEIACTVKGCFREHHYLPVETPLLEDKGSLEEGGRIADTPFKLFDDDGRLLVVRPDNTLPIVRLVSTRMRAADLPLRLRYEAPVVRECQRNAGGSRQFTQLGFELIGVGDTAGDVEIVSLVAEAVRKLALPDARIIAGSVRPFKELLAACEDRELAAEALRCVHANDFVGLDARVAASAEPEAVKAAISELPRLHGGAEILDRVDALLEAAGIVAPLTRELRALVEGLAPEDAQVLSFDFSIMNSFITTRAWSLRPMPVACPIRWVRAVATTPSLPARSAMASRYRRRDLPFRSSVWRPRTLRLRTPLPMATTPWAVAPRVRCVSPCPRARSRPIPSTCLRLRAWTSPSCATPAVT